MVILALILILQIVFSYPYYRRLLKDLNKRQPKLPKANLIILRMLILFVVGGVLYGCLLLRRGHFSSIVGIPSDQAGLGLILGGLNLCVLGLVNAQAISVYLLSNPGATK